MGHVALDSDYIMSLSAKFATQMYENTYVVASAFVGSHFVDLVVTLDTNVGCQLPIFIFPSTTSGVVDEGLNCVVSPIGGEGGRRVHRHIDSESRQPPSANSLVLNRVHKTRALRTYSTQCVQCDLCDVLDDQTSPEKGAGRYQYSPLIGSAARIPRPRS